MKEKIKQLAPLVGVSVALVAFAALLSFAFTDTQSAWYLSLKLPAIQPPSWVFSVVWPVLYILLIVVFYYILANKMEPDLFYAFVFAVILGPLWSFLFFSQHNMSASVFLLMFIVTLSAYCLYKLQKNKQWQAWLLLPFLLWQLYALILNYITYMIN